MSEQEYFEQTEQPDTDQAALIEGQENKKRRKDHRFGSGFFFGMLTMLLISMITVGILCITRVIYLSGGTSVADGELLAKANAIAAYLRAYSLYDYDEDALREGMLDGLMEGTGDKYAVYYNAEELAAVFDDYNGDFYGIGALIKQNDDGTVYVSGLYEDSPAERSGLQPGDVFKAVNGEDVEGLDRFDVASLIRGEEGTTVTITVYRESTGETLDLTAVRAKLKKIDVEYRMLDDKIGYIWIKDFDEVAIDQFADALATLKGQGMEDMILDLRTNTGGLLRAALDITRQIMCKGNIVTIRNAGGRTTEYDCDGKREFPGRIVILTDAYTASASEIMTGALKDNGMAVSLGTTTFGKGLVQGFYYLSDGSGIKFTTDEYLTPNGTAINGVGIEPDIELEFDYDLYVSEGTDNQLEAAIDYLK